MFDKEKKRRIARVDIDATGPGRWASQIDDRPSPILVWHHVVLTTYGAWLDGDPRGFRTKNHRKHIEGDHKHPPRPGSYKGRLRGSQELLSQEPVAFDAAWRSIVGNALRTACFDLDIELLAIAVSRQHVHLQMRTPFGRARHVAGILKNHAGYSMKQRGWTGKLWAKRSKAVPIRTRDHQVKVFRYIMRHAYEDAWVWHWKRGDDGQA
ncbi:MAG: hypothetical protein H0T47_08460 [Planctomycetaceae bacterium]|nr:hypothetical protein [Planctomycetaceae bacterium]